MIIADTTIVSELMKDAPEPRVLDWARGVSVTDLTISVVTVEEVERGLGRLPVGRRRASLSARWARLLDAFGDTIAIYDVAAAQATAQVVVEGLNRGRPLALADAQIAGICLARTATLATRNATDFAVVTDLALVNPFD